MDANESRCAGRSHAEPLEFDFMAYLARRLNAPPEELERALGCWILSARAVRRSGGRAA